MQGSFYPDSLALAELIHETILTWQQESIRTLSSGSYRMELSSCPMLFHWMFWISLIVILKHLQILMRHQRFWVASKLMGQKNIMKRDFCVTLVPGISAKSPQA